VQGSELFQVRKLRRNSTFAYKVPVERRRRPRHFEVQATDKLRRGSMKLHVERKCAQGRGQVSLTKSQEGKRKSRPNSRARRRTIEG
jgi:hypothetical protein